MKACLTFVKHLESSHRCTPDMGKFRKFSSATCQAHAESRLPMGHGPWLLGLFWGSRTWCEDAFACHNDKAEPIDSCYRAYDSTLIPGSLHSRVGMQNCGSRLIGCASVFRARTVSRQRALSFQGKGLGGGVHLVGQISGIRFERLSAKCLSFG